MASIVGKKRGGSTYYYLVESARVNGSPRIVSQEYLGTAEELAAAMRGGGLGLPDRVQHRDFGAVAAAWGVLEDLGIAGIIDEAAGPRRSDAGASTGTYLVLAALNRIADPRSKRAFADWWKSTSGPRFTKVSASVLGHRRFWDAMHSVSAGQLEAASHRIALRIAEAYGLDCSSVALDMTNFATFIATANARAPIAQRGKAKQKRTDLRIVGLGLVVTRDGGIPLTWHAYPGDRPDVTQFTAMIDQLRTRHEAICAALPAAGPASDMTVVFDAGQNSKDNFAHLAASGLHYIGSVPAGDCPDLTALPASRRTVVDRDRFGGLTAYETRRETYGAERRTILTHSPELHENQVRGFDGTTLAKAGKKLDELAATLARGKTRRSRDKVEAEIASVTAKPWARRVIDWHLDGEKPRDLRLSWSVNPEARAALEEELFGKHVLVTSREDWPAAGIVAGYRSQSEAEFAFRQLKDPHAVSFSPMYHWTEHNIQVHTFTCVLALQVAHLMRLQASRAGLDLSVRELLSRLAGIGETTLLYQGDQGRPRAHRMLDDTTPDQRKLADIFGLDRYAPAR